MTPRFWLAVRQVGQQQHELVAAQSCDDIVAAHNMGQSIRYLGQKQVAARVTVLVIDGHESVQIQQAHREKALLSQG